MTDERRLTRLELEIMQQHRLLEELSGVLAAQQAELSRLSAEVQALRERVRSAEEPIANETPPHY